jgi:hypothetical protein
MLAFLPNESRSFAFESGDQMCVQLSSLSCHIVLQTSVFSPHEAYENYFSTSNEHFCGYYDQIKCEKLQCAP